MILSGRKPQMVLLEQEDREIAPAIFSIGRRDVSSLPLSLKPSIENSV
jgi:hypothetical protein